MKFLIYGINYAPELTGTGKYTGEMAQWLAAQGHEVRVITAPPYYPQWRVLPGWSGWRWRKEPDAVTVWRCPLYVPSRPSTLKRLVHLASFAVSSLFPLLGQRRWRPDVIIGIAPTLFCVPGIRLLARLSGAHTVLHIQDFEVDAMLGLDMAGGGRGTLARLAAAFERSCLHQVDTVSTISRSMMNNAIAKGVPESRVMFFPNWSEVARFRAVSDADVAALRQQLGLPTDRNVLLYSGNVGEKQGLENVIAAAARFRDRPWLFAIVGEGGSRARLEKMVAERQLDNVRFLPLQPYDALLALADCHLVIQRRGGRGAAVKTHQHSGGGR